MTPGSRFSLFSGFGFFCLGGKDIGPDVSPYHYGTNILSSSALSLSPPLGVVAAVGSSASVEISLASPFSLPLS